MQLKPPPIEIIQVTSPRDAAEAAELMRGFVAWLRLRYVQEIWIVDRYFDPIEWEAELRSLLERYPPPNNAVLRARHGERVVGTVTFRALGDGVCEMKRMFVAAEAQGLGVGRALATALMHLAFERGFRAMRLDTGPLQSEAQALYESLGFRDIPCYYDCDEPLKACLRFMERALAE